jgi:hypothetical protein
VTQSLEKALDGSNFPGLGQYFMIDLVDDMMILLIPLDEFRWGIAVNKKSVQMGLLINVVLPKAIDYFEEALAE